MSIIRLFVNRNIGVFIMYSAVAYYLLQYGDILLDSNKNIFIEEYITRTAILNSSIQFSVTYALQINLSSLLLGYIK